MLFWGFFLSLILMCKHIICAKSIFPFLIVLLKHLSNQALLDHVSSK